MANHASRHIEPRFSVPDVAEYHSDKPTAETHAANLADYVTRINETIEAFGKARASRNIEQSKEHAITLDREARAYAKFFNLKLPKLPKLPVLDAEKMRVLKERESAADATRNAVKQAERAERDRIWALSNVQRIVEWRNGAHVDRYYIQAGEYALLRVKFDEKTGLHNLTAGCHLILWSEIESIADAVQTANDADASTAPQTNDAENINA